MKIPSNGKVIVFDDKYDQIANLLKSLSQEKIPYLYYQDEAGSDLPDVPVRNVRLVILDLQLVSDQNFSEENIVSSVGARFERTLEPNVPYILIYWSTKAKKYQTILEKSFEDRLSQFTPLVSVSMKKSEALKANNPVEFIKNELKQITEEFSSYYTMGMWESAVNDAAGSITNSLINIFDRQKNWDKNFKNLIYSLALAEIGKSHLPEYSDNEKLKAAISVINSMFIDSIDLETDKAFSEVEITDIKQGGNGLSKEARISLNSKLHALNDSPLKGLVRGNLYVEELNPIGKKIFKEDVKATFQESLKKEKTKIKSLKLDITPACDYAQKKGYSRILHGIAIAADVERKNLQDGEYMYKQSPTILIGGEPYFIFFDFRYLDSLDSSTLSTTTVNLRLRLNIILDIQAQISHNFNRPGIVTI
ncbi:hypothetical protein LVD17_22715 [Fulvivirga ulvae]|uniref:hypothetical protein n=1 Tax=Fulvivirga ulvae TaxID=2904245 RepID=UPI001F192225|nr:hypothetical protein [Fulvivirga ulvae]UII31108.1 hypothetical protein LVD17_22715 [Fulvivirga ulvae]